MSYPTNPGMIWHVIFHPGPSWWSREFRHVSLAGYSNDTWLHLDLGNHGVTAAPIFAFEEVQDYLTLLLAHYTVLRFGPPLSERRHLLRPMTCVTFVKHVLGIRSGALRPDGLFRDLVQNYDAQVLNESRKAPSGNTGTEATAHPG